MNRTRLVIGCLLAIALISAAEACRPNAPQRAQEADLRGTEWVLVSLHGNSPVEGTRITLGFGPEGAGGYAGCNRYGGRYETTGRGGLRIAELWQHLELCASPAGVMEQEEAFVETLRDAARFRVTDDRLEIEDAAGETALVFVLRAQARMNPDDLADTRWQLVSMPGAAHAEDAQITLVFRNAHVLSGMAGCRGYAGGYQASTDGIELYWLGIMGTEPCLRDGASLEQDGQYTTYLEQIEGYALFEEQIEDDILSEERLELLTLGGDKLVYARLPAEADTALEGTAWTLAAFVEARQVVGLPGPQWMPTDVLPGTAITARFEEGSVTGSAGCNAYSTAYAVDGPTLTVKAPSATEKLCLDPQGATEQEQRYLVDLANVTTYHVDGSQLWLETGDGRALIFVSR